MAVSVAAHSPLPAHIRALGDAGCRLHLRPRGGNLKDALRRSVEYRLPSHGWLAQRFKSVSATLHASAPDLVVLSQSSNWQGLSWMEGCQRAGVPYILVTQLALEDDWLSEPQAIPLAQAYSRALRALFVSQKNLELTQKQLGAVLPNAAVVRNPFKVSFDTRLEWPSPDGELRLACVAALQSHHKGQDLLLEVLSAPKWSDRALSLTLYGRGPNEFSLRFLRDRLGASNVHFADFTDDIEGIWARHHGLLMGSRIEGLPLAVVEAMLCGRVCIVPDVGGNGELIRHGVNGFLAAAPSVDSIDAALEEAWCRRDDWETIGARAAADARAAIPSDPVQVFVDLLKSCV